MTNRPLLPPDSSEWPCKTPSRPAPPRLISALYVLMRDYVHPGDLEEVCIHAHDATTDVKYTNPHLESYARSLATYLTDIKELESHDRTAL